MTFFDDTVQLLRDAGVNYAAARGAVPAPKDVAIEPGVTKERIGEVVDDFLAVAETAGGIEAAAIAALYRLAFAYGEDEAWRAVIEAEAHWLGWVLLVRSVDGLPEPQRGEALAGAVEDMMGRE
jgi:hypothetical protein